MIRIKVYEDGQQVQALSLDQTNIIIGREATADIQLQSDAVSRRHARLQRVGDEWQVGDLGAANGVYLATGESEPRRIVIEAVSPEDSIIIGTYSIQISEMEGEAASGNWKTDDFENHAVDPSKRTQFISMVDVLEATDGGSGEGKHVESTSTPEEKQTEDSPVDETAWSVRLTSDSGHDRTFECKESFVLVGSGDDCHIQLPSGPSRIAELDRFGPSVSLKKVTTWPFPRVTYDGRSVKTAVLQNGEVFSIGDNDLQVIIGDTSGSGE